MPQPTEDGKSERWIHLFFTWSGKAFELDIAESDRCVTASHYPHLCLTFCRVDDLKALLQSLTDVPPERQKILGLVKGKLPPDDETM